MKKIVCILLVWTSIIGSLAFAGGWDLSTASDWAKPELESAFINGIVQSGYEDYQESISRAQFAELIMNMYKIIMEEYPEQAPYDTFTDTEDPYVFMANAVGIINGKGGTIFAPHDPISRQEMAVMMVRALDSMAIRYSKGDGQLTIADKEDVAPWAVAGVDFAFENEFITGDGQNFSPLNNTPIEQAVIIVNRVFEKYKDDLKIFAIEVTNTNDGQVSRFRPDDMIFYSQGRYYNYFENDKGYMRVYPYLLSEDPQYKGPLGLVVHPFEETYVVTNGVNSTYETRIKFNKNGGNAGIVFNVVSAGDGNDNYSGYYAGLNEKTARVVLGKSVNGQWTKIEEVGYSNDGNYEYDTLKVIRYGSEIQVYVSGRLVISVIDDTFTDNGGFGVRTYNDDVAYLKFTVKTTLLE